MNGTRIAAWHGLFSSFIRMLAAINIYIAQHPSDEKIQKLKLSDSQVADLLVFEAVLEIVSVATTLVQYEKYFTGAYGAIIRSRVLEQLRAEHSKQRPRARVPPRCNGSPGPVTLINALFRYASPQSSSSTAP